MDRIKTIVTLTNSQQIVSIAEYSHDQRNVLQFTTYLFNPMHYT
jgi:hypothetical protein